MMMRLTDVSEHNNRPSFTRLKREDKIDGAAAKMSEGWGYEDPDGERNLREIIRADLVPLAYHFLWSGAPKGKGGRHQAEFLLRQIGKVVRDPRKVLPVADVEISSSMRRENYPTFMDVKRFLGTLEDRLDMRVCLYAGYYWRGAKADGHLGNPPIRDLGLKRRPIIWDPHYFHTDDAPAASFGEMRRKIPGDYFDTPAIGGMEADMIQFSDRVRFSEYVGDANLANTDREGLRRWVAA